MQTRPGPAFGRLVAVVVVALTWLFAGPATAGIARTDELPRYAQRVIAAPTSPGLAAWGLAYNPVSDELAVGDYVAKQVRRYSRAGAYLGDFTNPGGAVPGVASALTIDPRDGSYYLAVTGAATQPIDVVKYSATGRFIAKFGITQKVAWLAVDPSTGDLWIPDAFGGRTTIKRYAVSIPAGSTTGRLTLKLSIKRPGSRPGQVRWATGVVTDRAGNLYVADTGNVTVHVFGANGNWKYDIGNRTTLTGDLRGLALDESLDRLYVSNSAGATIEAFALSTRAWAGRMGSEGTGPGQFVDGARQLAVGPDHMVWAADYGQRRVLGFGADGIPAMVFPDPALPEDPAGLSVPRGVDVDPASGDVLVVDSFGQHVLRYATDGTLLARAGRRGSAPPDGMNYPKAVAVDPATGNVWVSSYEGQPFVLGYSADLTTGQGQIMTPRFTADIEISGGLLYTVQTSPAAVRVYDLTSKALVRQWASPVARLAAVAVDPATGDIWLGSESARSLTILSPSGAATTVALGGVAWGISIRGDRVFVSDGAAGVVRVLDRLTRTEVATIGGPGTTFGKLGGPAGLAVDPTGNLYVAEQKNGRITVFGQAPPVRANVPSVVIEPGLGSGVQPVVSGSAGAGAGIAFVDVQVRDTLTGQYFDTQRNRWSTTAAWNRAVVWGDITAPSWRVTVQLPLPASGTYDVSARAVDRAGVLSSASRATLKRT